MELRSQLADAQAGLLRALDFRTATPEGLAIKADVREALRRSGFDGPMGEVGAPIEVDQANRQPDQFEQGYLRALSDYAYTTSAAWAENGVQYVGTTGETRRAAATEFLEERGWTDPDAIRRAVG